MVLARAVARCVFAGVVGRGGDRLRAAPWRRGRSRAARRVNRDAVETAKLSVPLSVPSPLEFTNYSCTAVLAAKQTSNIIAAPRPLPIPAILPVARPSLRLRQRHRLRRAALPIRPRQRPRPLIQYRPSLIDYMRTAPRTTEPARAGYHVLAHLPLKVHRVA